MIFSIATLTTDSHLHFEKSYFLMANKKKETTHWYQTNYPTQKACFRCRISLDAICPDVEKHSNNTQVSPLH